MIELSKKDSGLRHILKNRPCNPGDVHVLPEGNVLGDDVSAPGTAGHGRCRRHAVECGTGVAAVVRLANHDTGNRCAGSQTIDVGIIPAVDTAGVTLAAYVEDGLHHVKCCLELVLILEQGKECGQLLGGEEVILADAFHSAAGNHKFDSSFAGLGGCPFVPNAAGNISTAVKNFEDRGYATVFGVVLNRRAVENEYEKVKDFTDKNGLKIVADIPRSNEIIHYEDMGKTVVEGDKDLEVSQKFIDLAKALIEADSKENQE